MKKKEKLISIVIPCYNVERYIERCLDSVVKQSIGVDCLEIICVNDASNDNTFNILKEWEEKYPDSIIVITYEENQKQGGARNIGIEYASAKYIGFLDSDDWIEPDMYEELYKRIIYGDFDVVRGKLIRDYSEGEMLKNIPDIQKDQEYCFTKVQGYYYAEPDIVGVNGDYSSINTGLYKKSIIVENQIYFPVGITYEDNYWAAMLKLYISKLYIIDRVFYHYYFRSDSTITSRNNISHLDRIIIEEAIVEKYIDIGIYDTRYFYVLNGFIERYYLNTFFIVFTRFDYIPDIYCGIREKIYEYFPNWDSDYFVSFQNEANILLLTFLKEVSEPTEEQLENLKKHFLDICRRSVKK